MARRLGAAPGRQETAVLAREVEFELSPEQERACLVDTRVPEIYFCDDLLGYGWALRKGRWLNVGLGREARDGLAGHAARFRELLVETRRVPPDTPEKWRGHAYTLRGRAARRLVGDGALLVGDAAGLAYAESGEGIRPAVESGLPAAAVIAGTAGDYTAARLGGYERRLAERFGPSAAAAARPGRWRAALTRATGRRLLAVEWFVRRVVVERWFLRRHVIDLAR